MHEPAQCGAVVAVQRASSDLKLNPRLHAVFLDGVYVPGADAAPEFRAPPRPSTTDVADALQVARARISNHSIKRIAAMVGYQDPMHFSRVFRAINEVSASEYRHLRKG